MNEKLHQCVGLVELLRDHLKDKHHTRLELMIIILIMIEVCVHSTFFQKVVVVLVKSFDFCYFTSSVFVQLINFRIYLR